jgi:cereblon
VFSASEAGACAAWANPHGYVHEVLTVVEAPGVEPVGAPETAHSWFAGTSWRHALCGGCGLHVGWEYAALAPGALPERFVGLRLALLADGRP